MRVRKRGNKWYYTFDIYENGNRKIIERCGGSTKKEAEEKGIQEEASFLKTGIIYDNSMKLKTLTELYMTNYAEIRLKKWTLVNTKLHLKIINKKLGNVRIRDLTPMILQEFIIRMAAENRSSNNYKKCLRGLFSFAVRMDLLQKNPCTNLVAINKPAKKKEIITNADIKVIMNSRIASTRLLIGDYRNEQIKDLVLLLYLTGVRLAESLALRFEDCDLENKQMRIVRTADREIKDLFDSPKTSGSVRTVALNDSLVALIRKRKAETMRLAYISEGDIKINLIFADIDGSTIKQGTLRRYAKKIGKIINKDFGFHSLRTAHATELLTAGVAIKLVKERLGHSTIQTTLNHYTSISKGMEEQCINALDGLYEY